MPKISLNGGPSYAGHEGLVADARERVSEIDPDHQGRFPLVGEPTEEREGGVSLSLRRKEEEESSPGNNSQPSTEKPHSTEKTSETDDPKPALRTESRSGRTSKAS